MAVAERGAAYRRSLISLKQQWNVITERRENGFVSTLAALVATLEKVVSSAIKLAASAVNLWRQETANFRGSVQGVIIRWPMCRVEKCIHVFFVSSRSEKLIFTSFGILQNWWKTSHLFDRSRDGLHRQIDKSIGLLIGRDVSSILLLLLPNERKFVSKKLVARD